MTVLDVSARKHAARELRRASGQAASAIGVFHRWAADLEHDPDHAIKMMRKVLSSDPKRPNPYLIEAATNILSLVKPAAIGESADHKAATQERRVQFSRISRRADELRAAGREFCEAFRMAEAEINGTPLPAKPQRQVNADGNVLAVDFQKGSAS